MQQAQVMPVCLVGDKGVGKTSVLERLNGSAFSDYYPESRPSDYHVTSITREGLKFHEIASVSNDTLIQGIYTTLRQPALVVVLDMTQPACFDYVKKVFALIPVAKKRPILFVCNKMDLSGTKNENGKLVHGNLLAELAQGSLRVDCIELSKNSDVNQIPEKLSALLTRAPMRPRLNHEMAFNYNHELSGEHSRKARKDLLEDIIWTLPCQADGSLSVKQLLILLAHYMSIDKVKSELSLAIEAVLIQDLKMLIPAEAFEDSARAWFRGKPYDDVARLLAREVSRVCIDRFESAATGFDVPGKVQDYIHTLNSQTNILTELLQCVDKFEVAFFSRTNEVVQRQICDTIILAHRVYDHILNPRFNGDDADLTKGLDLPMGVYDILRRNLALLAQDGPKGSFNHRHRFT